KFSLRAIPWILCWTQTRLLLPIWWGIGFGWENLSADQKKKFKMAFKTSPVLQTYVKNLGFSLAKVELGVWNFHLNHSDLEASERERWREMITTEHKLAHQFFREITGETNLTWYRPWLG